MHSVREQMFSKYTHFGLFIFSLKLEALGKIAQESPEG